MSHQKLALILGSGPRVGRKVSRAFAAKGYQVALASRTLKEEDNEHDQMHFPVDLSNPSSVPELFSQVKASLGIPHVVVYNASAGVPNDAKDPFSISLDDVEQAVNVTITSVFAAAQEATKGFAQLPESVSKTFIYTGNALNSIIIGPLMAAGVGKSGTAHMMRNAAQLSEFKFYYADERNADGSPVYGKISGEAHGMHYVKLAEERKQGPWLQTFVQGSGFKQF